MTSLMDTNRPSSVDRSARRTSRRSATGSESWAGTRLNGRGSGIGGCLFQGGPCGVQAALQRGEAGGAVVDGGGGELAGDQERAGEPAAVHPGRGPGRVVAAAFAGVAGGVGGAVFESGEEV